LYYSGLNGYTSIVEYYNKTVDLNSDNLDTETIDKILRELSELREKSKQLNQEYLNYRKKQKQQRFRAISKKEKMIWKENCHRINLLWDRYDTDENRLKKELLYTQRQKEIVEYRKKTSIENLNKLD